MAVRGHVMFDWDPTPARLAIWTLRVISVGRHECPGLLQELTKHLGEDAQQAIQATQVLTFLIQKSAPPPARDAFSTELEPHEELIAAALEAIARKRSSEALAAAQQLCGPHAPIALAALTELAGIYARRGLVFTPAAVA
jgi:hypothetical protein